MADSEFGAEQTQDDPMVGEYEANEQSRGHSEDTGVTYDANGEPERTPNDEAVETDVEDSNPNAGSPEGLEGGMGISSERTFPVDDDEEPSGAGIQGTGSVGSATTGTHGTLDPSGGGPTREHAEDPAEGPDMEEANAGVQEHPFDAAKNPGHSHG